MKMTTLFLLLALSAAAGYLFGTEAGRQQKELILVRLGRKEGGEADVTVEEAIVN